MELRWLETFLAIAETRSFTRAAERLHLSQPAVTRQVQALEDACGGLLFARQTRRVVLTPAGELMVEHGRRILAAVAESGQALGDLRSGLAGRLSLGASSTVATYFLPALLAEYRRAHPRHELRVHTGLSGTIVDDVAGGRLDFGLVMDFAGDAELREQALGSYEMAVILPPGHRLAGARRITARELSGEPLVSMAAGTNLRRFTDALFDTPPTLAIEVDNIEAIKRMVEAGIGVAVVPRVAVGAERVVARRFGPARRWSIVWRRERPLTPPMQAFLALATSSAASHSRPRRRAHRRKG